MRLLLIWSFWKDGEWTSPQPLCCLLLINCFQSLHGKARLGRKAETQSPQTAVQHPYLSLGPGHSTPGKQSAETGNLAIRKGHLWPKPLPVTNWSTWRQQWGSSQGHSYGVQNTKCCRSLVYCVMWPIPLASRATHESKCSLCPESKASNQFFALQMALKTQRRDCMTQELRFPCLTALVKVRKNFLESESFLESKQSVFSALSPMIKAAQQNCWTLAWHSKAATHALPAANFIPTISEVERRFWFFFLQCCDWFPIHCKLYLAGRSPFVSAIGKSSGRTKGMGSFVSL